MHLICRQCATQLTEELQLVPFEPREDAVEEEFVGRGHFMRAERSFYFDTADVGNLIANIGDARNMKLTSDSNRLSGCCGPSSNTPNLQCEVCDAYVATKMQDCCIPHYVVFDPSTTQAA